MSFTEALPGALPAAPASLVDTKKISSHLAQLSAIEKGWSLPAIPDLVKLDLASNSPDKESLNSLLYGLESDLKHNDPGDPAPGFTPIPVHNGRTVTQELTNQWGGWTGLRPPQQADTDAVSIFKADAVAKGLLPADTPIDSRWDPSYSSIQHDMLQTQYDDRMGGNRPGAASWQKVASVFNDWGSPTGLLRAAVSLDLMWDFKAIGRESQQWGDKWRKIGHSKNPFDMGKNLFDALTGPIDDIIVPVLNDILLVTGISEAYSFARLTMAAKKGIEFAEVAKDLYQGARVVEDAGFIQKWQAGVRAKVLGEAEAFSKPSWIAKRTGGFGSHVMEPWRQLPTTLIGKKGVQTVMKFGLVSRLEDTLPNQSGLSLASVPGVQKNVDDFTQNPFVWSVGETLFTPSTIFGHGAVTRWAKSAGSKAITVAEKTHGLGVGPLSSGLESVGDVIGWKKYHLRNFARKMAIMDAVRITKDEAISGSFVKATQGLLADDADVLAKFNKTLRERGSNAAMMELHGLSEAELGTAMSYAIVNAGHDLPGKVKLMDMGIADGEERGYKIYHGFRDKSIAQVRKWDPGDRSGLLAQAALVGGGSDEVVARRFADMMADTEKYTDDLLNEMAFTHNTQADEHLKTLLAHVTPEVLDAYLPKVMPTFGHWSPFVESQQMLHDYNTAGLFDGAQFTGAELGYENATHGVAIQSDLQNLVGASGTTASTVRLVSKNSYAPLARPITRTSGRFTAMLKGTLAKKEVIDTAAGIRHHLKVRDIYTTMTLGDRDILSGVDRTLAYQGLHMGTADAKTVRNLLEQAAASAGGPTWKVTGDKKLKTIIEYMKVNNVGFDQIEAHLDETTSMLENSEEWGSRFGFQSVVKDKEGRILYGDAALKVRQGQLMHKSNYTAAEVDMEHLLSQHAVGSEKHTQLLDMQRKFDETGYKLVHGVEFSSPVDLMDRGMPFSTRGGVDGLYPDITQRHLNGIRLGLFTTAHQDNPAYLALLKTRKRVSIAEALDEHKAYMARTGKPLHPGIEQLKYHHPGEGVPIINPDAPDLDYIVNDLYQNIIEPATNAAADARLQMESGGFIGKLGSRAIGIKTPKSFAELGLNYNQPRVMKYLTPQFGPDGALAIWKAIKKSRVGEFENVGLASLEQRFRSNPVAVSALKTLGGVGQHKGYARFAGGIVGQQVGANLAGDQDPSVQLGARFAGFAAGYAGTAALTKGIGKVGAIKLADRLEHSARWARYGYLADEVMQYRDLTRFALSPMFDAYRYAHGQVFGVTEDVGLRINQTPSALRRQFAKAHVAAGATRAEARLAATKDWESALSRYRHFDRHHDFEAIDDAQRWFHQVGIAGYDGTKMEASTFHQLMDPKIGMTPEQAMEKVRVIYGYGDKGRSPLNQSMNTIFFPFSFQAKQTKAIVGFLSKDWSRAVAVHDAYKTYELLNEHFDLNKFWHDHLPALEQLQRLNFFAHGVSPGVLGGLNRPLIDIATSAPDAIRNFFEPQGVAMSKDLLGAVKKLGPAYTDIDYFVQSLKEQGHVMFGPAHEIAAVEASDGFQEWNSYKKSVEEALVSKGYKWADLYSKPALAGLEDSVVRKKLELQTKYPGWKDAMERSIHNIEAINQEQKQRASMYRNGTPLHPDYDQAFMEYSGAIDMLDNWMRENGLSVKDDMDRLPLEFLNKLREAAVAYASEPGLAGEGFRKDYDKYWKKRLGPIMRDV